MKTKQILGAGFLGVEALTLLVILSANFIDWSFLTIGLLAKAGLGTIFVVANILAIIGLAKD